MISCSNPFRNTLESVHLTLVQVTWYTFIITSLARFASAFFHKVKENQEEALLIDYCCLND